MFGCPNGTVSSWSLIAWFRSFVLLFINLFTKSATYHYPVPLNTSVSLSTYLAPILILPCVWMSIDGFWIDDRIYWTFWYSAWLYFAVHYHAHTHTHTHTHTCDPSHIFISRCSVAASNGERSSSSGSPNCSPLSYQLLTVTAHNDWTSSVA
jgi:hypothetical protein